MKQSETQINHDASNHLSRQNTNYSLYEAGRLRRAKMHAAHFIEAIDSRKMLTPSLQRLLEASFVLETTNTNILAAYLKQSPATVRNEFQRICTILEDIKEVDKISHIKISSITKEFALSEK